MAKSKAGKKRKGGEVIKLDPINPFTAKHGHYRETTVVDLSGELGGKRGMATVLRNLYPNIADRWLAEGGPGFEEPQRRAIEHCRSLWHRAATEGRLVANLDRVRGSSGGDGWTQHEALSELATFKARLPLHSWDVFENVVRWDEPAGAAGSKYSNNPHQAIAHAKASVGFVLSMIAQWRGF
jgi:hypothetical protein